ncbi:hypothetical protein NL676_022483 [Syzygium grande]|nr:hypothetical protein NL676_022483 [Syzygium grande]
MGRADGQANLNASTVLLLADDVRGSLVADLVSERHLRCCTLPRLQLGGSEAVGNAPARTGMPREDARQPLDLAKNRRNTIEDLLEPSDLLGFPGAAEDALETSGLLR